MAGANEANVRIRMSADTSGGKEAQRVLDGVEKSARKAEAATKSAGAASGTAGGAISGAFKTANGAISKASEAVGAFTRALGLIGLAVSAVQIVIAAFQKMKDWLDRDKTAAEELARAIQDRRNAEAVDHARESYDRLNKAISETLARQQQLQRLADTRKGVERANEDAQIDLEEQQAVDKIDVNDPDYAEKVELVRSGFSRRRATLKSRRAVADAIERRTRLMEGSQSSEEQADMLEKEVYGKGAAAVSSMRRQRRGEKDPARQKKLDEQINQMVEENARKIEEARKLREAAAAMRKEIKALSGSESAALKTEKTEVLRIDAADAATRRRMEANRAERERRAGEEAARRASERLAAEKDARTISFGNDRIKTLQGDIEYQNGRLEAAGSRANKEDLDVYLAQRRLGDFDLAHAGRRMNRKMRGERASLEAEVRREEAEAAEAKANFEQVRSSVGERLRQINEEIREFKREIDAATSRQNARADNGGASQ